MQRQTALKKLNLLYEKNVFWPNVGPMHYTIYYCPGLRTASSGKKTTIAFTKKTKQILFYTGTKVDPVFYTCVNHIHPFIKSPSDRTTNKNLIYSLINLSFIVDNKDCAHKSTNVGHLFISHVKIFARHHINN